MSLADQLYRLQGLDQQRDSKRLRLADVECALKDSDAVQQAQQRLSAASTLANRRTAKQTDLELELQGLVDKSARESDRLYSGSVRNPKQLEELQEEVASLHRRQTKIEDDLLQAMIENEEAEADLDGARGLLAAAEENQSTRQAELGAERLALRRSLADIDEERATLTAGIGGGDIAAYESLRKRKGGAAVAAVVGDTCTACGVAVSANRKWHMREGNLVYCANCQRIIVLA